MHLILWCVCVGGDDAHREGGRFPAIHIPFPHPGFTFLMGELRSPPYSLFSLCLSYPLGSLVYLPTIWGELQAAGSVSPGPAPCLGTQ